MGDTRVSSSNLYNAFLLSINNLPAAVSKGGAVSEEEHAELVSNCWKAVSLVKPPPSFEYFAHVGVKRIMYSLFGNYKIADHQVAFSVLSNFYKHGLLKSPGELSIALSLSASDYFFYQIDTTHTKISSEPNLQITGRLWKDLVHLLPDDDVIGSSEFLLTAPNIHYTQIHKLVKSDGRMSPIEVLYYLKSALSTLSRIGDGCTTVEQCMKKLHLSHTTYGVPFLKCIQQVYLMTKVEQVRRPLTMGEVDIIASAAASRLEDLREIGEPVLEKCYSLSRNVEDASLISVHVIWCICSNTALNLNSEAMNRVLVTLHEGLASGVLSPDKLPRFHQQRFFHLIFTHLHDVANTCGTSPEAQAESARSLQALTGLTEILCRTLMEKSNHCYKAEVRQYEDGFAPCAALVRLYCHSHTTPPTEEQCQQLESDWTKLSTNGSRRQFVVKHAIRMSSRVLIRSLEQDNVNFFRSVFPIVANFMEAVLSGYDSQKGGTVDFDSALVLQRLAKAQRFVFSSMESYEQRRKAADGSAELEKELQAIHAIQMRTAMKLLTITPPKSVGSNPYFQAALEDALVLLINSYIELQTSSDAQFVSEVESVVRSTTVRLCSTTDVSVERQRFVTAVASLVCRIGLLNDREVSAVFERYLKLINTDESVRRLSYVDRRFVLIGLTNVFFHCAPHFHAANHYRNLGKQIILLTARCCLDKLAPADRGNEIEIVPPVWGLTALFLSYPQRMTGIEKYYRLCLAFVRRNCVAADPEKQASSIGRIIVTARRTSKRMLTNDKSDATKRMKRFHLFFTTFRKIITEAYLDTSLTLSLRDEVLLLKTCTFIAFLFSRNNLLDKDMEIFVGRVINRCVKNSEVANTLEDGGLAKLFRVIDYVTDVDALTTLIDLTDRRSEGRQSPQSRAILQGLRVLNVEK
ncbi:hypothetical protein ADEAN_000059100 [Angomonas deanei]|uniref:Uncharacterized protein n=1 Tax=Angomonas deanei TaxID=59799 RepID=A0A7G2C0V1_9TRYP|nr:hypothetical protein ADEAN_000059100 [Angomonas deanei]